MARPFVSVLIDTYNHETFVEEAIASVCQQDFPASETEILVVDDGSTDRTAEIAAKFSPRVRVLRKVNGGQASAFNAGIPEARGQIVAFLDGDDWWTANKLSTVARVFKAEPEIGLIGHGIMQISADQQQRTEVPREICRYRIRSVREARRFRMQRGFFGTSRMTCRRKLLEEIGPVPETLQFEADEYIFTVGALLTDVMVLDEALTFYRLHDNNLFQLADGNIEGARRKQRVLAALVEALDNKLTELKVPEEIARTILESVDLESDALRLKLESGFPWETIATEVRILRAFHSDASVWQHLFSLARLVPALVMPARAYYRYRQRLSQGRVYQRVRATILPFHVPKSVERRDKPAS